MLIFVAIIALAGILFFSRKDSLQSISENKPMSRIYPEKKVEVKPLQETGQENNVTNDAASLEEVRQRLVDSLPNLLASSERNDKIDYYLFWDNFVNWLNGQEDIPEQTRESFRKAFRLELGMGPEE